jgi:hypothetical protein
MKQTGGRMLSDSTVKPGFVERAKEARQKDQEANDVSDLRVKTAAIDPDSDRVWIGNDPIQAIDQIKSEGFGPRVYIVRAGSDYFVRKGCR